MLIHIECFKIIPPKNNTDKKLTELKTRLESLPNDIAQIRSLEFGFNKSGKRADAVMVALFDDEKSLEAFNSSEKRKETEKLSEKILVKKAEINQSF